MKLKLSSREECDDYITKRFHEVPSLTYEEWNQRHDDLEKTLAKYGQNDIGGCGEGDFHVACDWFGTKTLHICANSRKIVSQKILNDIFRFIKCNEPEYGITIVGSYPQVMLIWIIVLTKERQMIAFGPTFNTRLRDQLDDPEVEPWIKVLDKLWK